MTLRVNRSVIAEAYTVSLDIEISNLDQLLNSSPNLCFELVEMLIDKVFSDSNDHEILVANSEITG